MKFASLNQCLCSPNDQSLSFRCLVISFSSFCLYSKSLFASSMVRLRFLQKYQNIFAVFYRHRQANYRIAFHSIILNLIWSLSSFISDSNTYILIFSSIWNAIKMKKRYIRKKIIQFFINFLQFSTQLLNFLRKNLLKKQNKNHENRQEPLKIRVIYK